MADEKKEDYRLDAPEGGRASAEKKGDGGKVALVVVGVIAAIALVVAIGFFGFKAVSDGIDAQMQPTAQTEQATQDNSFTDNAASKKASKKAKAAAADEEECDHEWKTVYKKVKHDAVYQTVTETHTVCNTCGKPIDGKTKQHAKKTGHEGYTTGVPKEVTKLVSGAYTEKVADHKECTECGETKGLDE